MVSFQWPARPVESRAERGRGKGADAPVQSCQHAPGLRRMDAWYCEGRERSSVSLQETPQGTHRCANCTSLTFFLSSPPILFFLHDYFCFHLSPFLLSSSFLFLTNPENYTIFKPLSAPMSCVCVSPNTVPLEIFIPVSFLSLLLTQKV